MSLLFPKRSLEDEVFVLRRQIKDLETRIAVNAFGVQSLENGADKHTGNENDEDNIYMYDDAEIYSALARIGRDMNALSSTLQQMSGLERRISDLELANTLRTIDFNVQDEGLHSTFRNLKTYKGNAYYTELWVNYSLTGDETDWIPARAADTGPSTGAQSTPKYTQKMFHQLNGMSWIFPGGLQFPLTYVRQKSWGADPFATRMAGKGGLEPDPLDFYSESVSWKKTTARVKSYPARYYKMHEGPLSNLGKVVTVITNLGRYAGAGALALVGARFGPAGLAAADVLSQELFSIDLGSLTTDLEGYAEELEDINYNSVRKVALEAVTLIRPAPEKLIPSDYAKAHLVGTTVVSVTVDQAQGYYITGFGGGGPTHFASTRDNSFIFGTRESTDYVTTDPHVLVSFPLGKCRTRYAVRNEVWTLDFNECQVTVPDYKLNINLSPNVCGSSSSEWKSGAYSNFGLHDGDGILLGGLLFAVFDYGTSTWMMYDETGAWKAV
jgi:hypothetical protein